MKRRSETVLTILVAVLAAVAAIAGLSVPTLYRDAPSVVPQALGQDAVTLFAVLPLLMIALAAARRGSLRGRLLWLGALGYMTYAYGTYALWANWNPLFLVYVAVFGCALYAVALGLVDTDAAAVRAALRTTQSARPMARFFVVTAILVSALWLAEEVTALVRGEVPPTLIQMETGTNVVHVFDLAVVMPAFVIAAVLLWRDRPWGYVLAGLLLVKAATIGAAVLAMMWFMAQAGFAVAAPLAVFFAALTTSAVALAWHLLRALPSGSVTPVHHHEAAV